MTQPRPGTKPVIGLVGGIGAGKSTAAAAFAARGGAVIDADALGHEALDQPDVRRQVLARWGGRGPLLRPDGRIDRRALAGVVFAHGDDRRSLEAIVFPIIGRRVQEEIDRADRDPRARFVVLDAAVMLEAGWTDVCHHLVYVDAPRPVRLARLSLRRGWSDADLTAREAMQMPAAEKRERADAVLVNDDAAEALDQRIDRLLRQWGLAGPESDSRRPEN